LRALA